MNYMFSSAQHDAEDEVAGLREDRRRLKEMLAKIVDNAEHYVSEDRGDIYEVDPRRIEAARELLKELELVE